MTKIDKCTICGHYEYLTTVPLVVVKLVWFFKPVLAIQHKDICTTCINYTTFAYLSKDSSIKINIPNDGSLSSFWKT